eukprot:4013155-Prorocentrum_lima.AAC.1
MQGRPSIHRSLRMVIATIVVQLPPPMNLVQLPPADQKAQPMATVSFVQLPRPSQQDEHRVRNK